MKPNHTGRFDKERGYAGGTDLQNVVNSAWTSSKAGGRGFRVPHQSISAMTDRTSEMAPRNLKHAKMREG